MRRSVILLCLLLLAGCALPAERSIRIDPPSGGAVLFDHPMTIALARLAARGVLQERNLAYIDTAAPTEVKQASTITWEETPENAASLYLSGALRRAGVTVLAPGTPGIAVYAVSGTVERFELVQSGTVGTATVALDLLLTDTKTSTPWFAGSYCAKATAADPALAAVETAFDTALADIAARLLADMKARASGAPAPAYAPHGSRLAPC